MKYKIVSSENSGQVIALVNSLLDEGYELRGELVVTEIKESSNERAYLVYSQALVLKEDK